MSIKPEIQDIIISLLLSLFLIGPASLLVAQEALKLDFPSWLTAEDAKYLTGASQVGGFGGNEDVESKIESNVSLSHFMTGQFQSFTENAVGHFIPCKAEALLGGAALQRGCIAASNALFSWPCYPTYYGSDVLYSPEYNFLTETTMKDTPQGTNGIIAFADQLAAFAKDHPDQEFCLVIADHPKSSSANPAAALVSDLLTTQDCLDLLKERTTNCPNIHVVSRPYTDTALYARDCYKTDTHWTGWGALSAYAAIVEEMNLAPLEANPGSVEGLEDLVFNGGLSRSGLMLLDAPVSEPQFDTESLSVVQGDEGYLLREDGAETLVEQGKEAEFHFYELWYSDNKPITIRNADNENESHALLIHDSYGLSLRWLLAQHYGYTYSKTHLLASEKTNDCLATLMEDSTSETVYFAGTVYDYSDFLSRHPCFFD